VYGLAHRLVRTGFVVALVAVALQTVAYGVNVAVFETRVQTLDADDDVGLFTWASASVTFAAAFVAFVVAVQGRRVAARWGVLAVIFAFFSLDDAVRVHERLAVGLTNAFDLQDAYGRLFWAVVYAPLLLTAFSIVWKLVHRPGNPVHLVRGLPW